MSAYSLSEVRRGYEVLGHTSGYTELVALHPAYRRGNAAWNREHQAWPIIEYATTSRAVEELACRYAGERLVCYGINPRPAILTATSGRLRSAREADIAVSQNLLLDFDLIGTVTMERLAQLTGLLGRVDEYVASLGCQRGVRASTGRGSHLLFAYPPVLVQECPDIRDQLVSFRARVFGAIKHDLSRLEARLDSTQDLRRMVRVYGTAKPGVGVISRLYARRRVADEAFREHLLGLPSRPPTTTNDVVVALGNALPSWFTTLLAADSVVRNLWDGTGKRGGDLSSSGYDFSLLCRVIRLGHTAPDDLGTILALRPGGSAHKGLSYVSRTVNNALAEAMR